MLYEECHKLLNEIDHKLCSICLLWLPCNADYYYKNKLNKLDGYYPYCKKCSIKKSKNWNEDNPEKYKTLKDKHNANRPEHQVMFNRLVTKRRLENGKQKEWRQSERGKSAYKRSQEKRKSKKWEINNLEWSSCKEYFNNACAYCGLSLEEHRLKFQKDLHREHVDDEGANDLSNCIPSCQNCNSSKWTFDFEEWYNQNNPIFSTVRYSKILKWLDEDWKIHKSN